QKKSEISYTNGLYSGNATYWYPNGKKQLEEAYIIITSEGKERLYVDSEEHSVLHGNYKTYNIKGINLISGKYELGKKVDKWIMNNNNGDRIRIEQYLNDQPDGKWESWYDHGVKKSEINYKNGLKEGKTIYYDPKGNIEYEALFRGNRVVEVYVDQTKAETEKGTQYNR
ncbi:MAG: hypothetical protein PHE08_02295, partial [Bacteroidales bacterium]|nr:hypothetical protein [Bacteroidales bacterium]